MTLSQKAVEAAAEAMEAKRIELQHAPLARLYNDLAQAALTAALAVDGLCLVPKEPTGAMINAGHLLDPLSCDVDEEDTKLVYGKIYRAMIAAASDGEERR